MVAIDLVSSTALDLKAAKSANLSDLASASTARTNLGLGNVDNTRDVNKPVSTLQAAAIDTASGSSVPSVLQGLPQLQKYVRTYNDNIGGTARTIGLGSSVGLGPNGSIDATNAVSAKVHGALTAAFNRLGNITWTHTNGSVGGTILFDGVTTHYAAAKTTAGGTPNVVVLAYGMNDGQVAQYHAGQTYPGVYSNAVALIRAAQNDGADVIVVTSPHPHSTRNNWDMGGVPVSYPATATQVPNSTAGQSVINVVSPSGATVPADYRHLRVNEAMRQAATDTGAVIIDAEPYWFDAIAAHGEDALFDTGEIVHPNLFGFQQSYHKAIARFALALNRPPVLTAPASTAREILAAKGSNEVRNNTTTLAAVADLSFTAGPNQVWAVEIDLFYTTPEAADIRVGFSFPTGATGSFSVIGPGTTATAINDVAVTRRAGLTVGNYISAGYNAADGVARVTAVVRTSSTAGTVALIAAQDTASGSNTTIYADSLLRATRIS